MYLLRLNLYSQPPPCLICFAACLLLPHLIRITGCSTYSSRSVLTLNVSPPPRLLRIGPCSLPPRRIRLTACTPYSSRRVLATYSPYSSHCARLRFALCRHQLPTLQQIPCCRNRRSCLSAGLYTCCRNKNNLNSHLRQ